MGKETLEMSNIIMTYKMRNHKWEMWYVKCEIKWGVRWHISDMTCEMYHYKCIWREFDRHMKCDLWNAICKIGNNKWYVIGKLDGVGPVDNRPSTN